MAPQTQGILRPDVLLIHIDRVNQGAAALKRAVPLLLRCNSAHRLIEHFLKLPQLPAAYAH